MTVQPWPEDLFQTIQNAGPYTITFPFAVPAEVQVWRIHPSGEAFVLEQGDFEVVFDDPANGGTFFLAPEVVETYEGQKIFAWRQTTVEQGWAGQAARERGLEAQLDALTRALQEARNDNARSMRFLKPVRPFVPEANRVLAFNAAGQPVNGPLVPEVQDVPGKAQEAAASAAAAQTSRTGAEAAASAAAADRALAETARQNAQQEAGVAGQMAELAASNARLNMGAVETLAPGSAAQATITGLPGSQQLHLSIPAGLKGNKGDPGPRGIDGSAVKILGGLADPSELPAEAEPGDSYLIDGDLYVWDGAAWQDQGRIQGPRGLTGKGVMLRAQGGQIQFSRELGEPLLDSDNEMLLDSDDEVFTDSDMSDWFDLYALEDLKGPPGDAAALVPTESFVASADQTQFTLSAPASAAQVFVGGLFQRPGAAHAYTLSGQILIFTEAPPAGVVVSVIPYQTGST
ncbi:MAG: hypothetical protein ACK4LQ_02065 [Pararhodobacter sp.]